MFPHFKRPLRYHHPTKSIGRHREQINWLGIPPKPRLIDIRTVQQATRGFYSNRVGGYLTSSKRQSPYEPCCWNVGVQRVYNGISSWISCSPALSPCFPPIGVKCNPLLSDYLFELGFKITSCLVSHGYIGHRGAIPFV